LVAAAKRRYIGSAEIEGLTSFENRKKMVTYIGRHSRRRTCEFVGTRWMVIMPGTYLRELWARVDWFI
jgi:hypothetical protein